MKKSACAESMIGLDEIHGLRNLMYSLDVESIKEGRERIEIH